MIGQLCRRFALILAVFAVLPAVPAIAIANVRERRRGRPAETNAAVTFDAVAVDEAGAAVPASIYVGKHEDHTLESNNARSLTFKS